MYNKGLHILCEMETDVELKLISVLQWKDFIENVLREFSLQQVGEVIHEFENKSYTAVHCLSESHIAVHTWPEFKIVTFDVFLCSYRNDNAEKVEQVATKIRKYFEGRIIQWNKISR